MTTKSFVHYVSTPSASSSDYSETTWQNETAALRNTFATKLTYTNSPWKVSQIAKFTGSGSANRKGFLFLVRHNSGPEWLFMFALNVTSTSSDGGFNYYPTDRFRTASDNSTSVSNWPNFLMHYNTDYNTASYGMQFDDQVEMTYTNNDFKVLASDTPVSAGFWPNVLAGSSNSASFGQSPPRTDLHPLVFSFCDSLPSVSYIDIRSLQNAVLYGITTSGEIINPIDPGDTLPTKKSGWFGGRHSYSLGGLSLSANQGDTAARYARYYNTAGTALNAQTFNFTGDKTILNHTASGVFTGRPLPLDNTKGILNPEFFLEAGALNDFRTFNVQFKTANNENLIKLNGLYTIPWEAGVDWWQMLKQPF
jgi:hypothetical protein